MVQTGSVFFLITALTLVSSGTKEEEIHRLSVQFVKDLTPHRDALGLWAYNLASDRPTNTPSMSTQAEFLTCDVCPIAFTFLRMVQDLGGTDEEITNAISKLCELFDLSPTDDICEPTIRGYVVPISYMVRHRPSMSKDDFCGLINENCGTVNATFTSWETKIAGTKPSRKERPPLPSGLGKTKILQFTDLHVDMDYAVGKNTNCPYPICCREANGDPADPSEGAGPYGHKSCGMPVAGMEEMYKKAALDHSDAKYIFLTGDYIHSGVWLYGVAENERHILTVTAALKAAFPNTTVVAISGNHETDIVNMYPPPEIQDDFPLKWMYTAISGPFEEYMGNPGQIAAFHQGGFYTVSPEPGLRFIILNTNICYNNNFWLPFDPIDPIGQLQWFSTELAKAEVRGENVYIIAHIPPGSSSCWAHWSDQYDRIVDRYSHIIHLQFFGHTHNDYYTVSFDRDDQDRPNSLGFRAPSGVGDGGGSCFKVYYVDGERGEDSTWELMDHETWILDLPKSNAESSPHWSKLYTASEDFGLTSQRPEDYYDFTLRMIQDRNLFEKYRNIVTTNENPPPCGDDLNCVSNVLCDTVVANSADKKMCDKIRDMVRNPPNSEPSSHHVVSKLLFVTTSIFLMQH